jgi:hypothetical protein
MKYTDASAFAVLLAPMDVAIAEHEARCQQLARTIEEKKQSNVGLAKSKQKPTTLDETRLRRAEKDLEEAKQEKQSIIDLKLKPIDLAVVLMECEGTLWTAEEAPEWGKEVANQEGRGEKGLRMRHGLPLVSTTQDVDLPEINEEVKCVEAATGKALQAMRPGTLGNKIFGGWVFLSAEAGTFKGLSEEYRQAFMFGEVLRPMLYGGLPDEIRNAVHELLSPTNVLGHYNAINATTRHGFIRIPKEDADAAWGLVTITKGGPKYELRTSYLVERLKRTLTA